ncbi:MAG: ribosomal protein L7/L12 [Candidatus Sericytochromatia bacterium]|nr:ribosomal protein L7/L12 [Candidatus Sericytochromatia bacterium]
MAFARALSDPPYFTPLNLFLVLFVLFTLRDLTRGRKPREGASGVWEVRTSPQYARASRDALARRPLNPEAGEGEGDLTLWLLAPGHRRIDLIKAVRVVTRLPLAEAYALVESTPIAVLRQTSPARAEGARLALAQAGGELELRREQPSDGAKTVVPTVSSDEAPHDLTLQRLPDSLQGRAQVVAVVCEQLGWAPETAEERLSEEPAFVFRGLTATQARRLRRELEEAGADVSLD